MAGVLIQSIWGLVFLLLATIPGVAEPVVTSEKNGRAGIAVATVSGLDPETTYWITLVSPEETIGTFGPFEYLSGGTDGRVSFVAPSGPAEWRLHQADDANRLVARAPYGDAAAEPMAAAMPDPVLRVFADRYGMVGRWSGGFTCAFGEASVTVDLRPGRALDGYEDATGTITVTMTEGEFAGGSGSGPIQLTRREGTDIVSPTPLEVIDMGAGPYTLSQLTGLTLSEGGLRMSGDGPRLPGCRDFTLDRDPLPDEDDALAAVDALAAAGFAGEWVGTYNCGAPTTLSLRFAQDPVLRLPVASWTYAGQGYQGRHDFEVALTGAMEAMLRPLHWVQLPRGHMVSDVRLRPTPDGAALQGSFEGPLSACAPFVLRSVPDTPAVVASDPAVVAGLAGSWEGLGRCGAAGASMRIDVPAIHEGQYEGAMRIAMLTGPRGTKRLRFIERFDGRLSLQEIDAGPSGMIGGIRPKEVNVDGDGLRLSFDTRCEPMILSRRGEPDPARTFRLGDPRDGQAFALDGPDGLLVGQPATLCAAVAEWSGRLSGEERLIRDVESGQWGAWPDLFAEPIFSDAFGVAFNDLAQTPMAGDRLIAAMQENCPVIGGDADTVRSAFRMGFGLDGEAASAFGSPTHRFRAAVALASPAVSEAAELIAGIEAADPADPKALSLWRVRVERAAFPHADLKSRAEASLARLADETTLAQARATVMALIDGTTPATRETLLEVESALGMLDERERAALRTRLGPAAQTVADAMSSAGDVGTLGERYAGLRAYPVIGERIDALTQAAAAERARQEAAAAARTERLRGEIAATTRIASLDRLRPAIATQTGLDASELWSAFDKRAATLLDEAVASLPENEARSSAPPETPIPGLNEGVLIAAFLSGDPTPPYRSDRERTVIYLSRLTAVFREYCPAALPPDLPRLLSGEFVDIRALTGSRDEMAAAGLSAILEGLTMLADPGAAMDRATRTDELHLAADGDAQILLGTLVCGNDALRTMFENVRTYVADPRHGVPEGQLRLSDLCLEAFPGSEAYCSCAGPQVEKATPELQRYLRANAPAHWRNIATLDRLLWERLQACRK